MPHQLTTSYLKDSLDLFRYYKKLGERAMAQCPDEGLFTILDPESNSIAIIVKHMAGNMRSRWMDFLTTDGEKPDRNRDTEFEEPPKTRADVLQLWERGWKCVFDALEPLTDADLTRTITIRTEAHSVMQAINRQITHYAHHVGQIVFLAKHLSAKAMGFTERPSRAVEAVRRGRRSRPQVAALNPPGVPSPSGTAFASSSPGNPLPF